MENYMKNVTIMNHPLIDHKITHLCDVSTGTKEFRELVSEIAMLMGYEAFRNIKTKNVKIQAPLSSFDSPVVDEEVVICPILRAGLGMVDGLVSLFPNARVGHIGLYRDEETLKPHTYYFKIPPKSLDAQFIVVDPALATGGSASAAIGFLEEKGCKNITLLSLIASPQGVKTVTEAHPNAKIFVAHYADAPLNEKGYIITAFGDAGDRIFGTI